MSCPNWRELAAHRSSRSGQEPEGYREALAHLDTCKACWNEALAADPSLLFRRLPEPTVEEFWDAEVASVQQAVAAMRTASRLESLQKSPRREVLGWSWKEWAAAAALAVTVGSLGTWYESSRPVEMAREALSISEDTLAVPAAGRIEDLEGSYSKVEELGGETRDDIVIRMFYDKSLDV